MLPNINYAPRRISTTIHRTTADVDVVNEDCDGNDAEELKSSGSSVDFLQNNSMGANN